MDNKKELAAELQRRLENDYLNDNYQLTNLNVIPDSIERDDLNGLTFALFHWDYDGVYGDDLRPQDDGTAALLLTDTDELYTALDWDNSPKNLDDAKDGSTWSNSEDYRFELNTNN